ncbi:hypothetical protein HY045_00665 [Candidatus Woesebacteria bacterium]|nr:hypothetical protein [Candidatus Woesebacteria bacterium]
MKERSISESQSEKTRKHTLVLLAFSVGVGTLIVYLNSSVCTKIQTNPPYTFEISATECILPFGIDIFIVKNDSTYVSIDLHHTNPDIHRSNINFELPKFR